MLRALLPLLFAAGSALADAPVEGDIATRLIDSARSRAEFEVKVLWLIGVHGRFDQVYGEVALDRFRSTANVNASLRVKNVSMRNRKYEDWVKSNEFFDAEHFPEIHFVSDWFDIDRLADGGEIDGMLTIRNVTRRVRFEILPSACPSTAANTCPAEVQGSIARSDFGMHSRRGTLSDEVGLRFAIFVAAQDATSVH